MNRQPMLLVLFSCLTIIVPAGTVAAQTESVIHSFRSTSTTDGVLPLSGLVVDARGALYGTTVEGGKFRHGAIYKLSPPTSQGGVWKQDILYSFTGNSDGASPMGSLFVNSRSGKIYGTTEFGGTQNFGAAFQLAPPTKAGGSWTLSVLYSFAGLQDGGQPQNGLVADAKGRLYGTAPVGGLHQSGVAFRLSSSPTGVWSENVIFNFIADADGGRPQPNGLLLDSAGALYGATQFGGGGQGTIFKLSPPSNGTGFYAETVLYSFTGVNGDGIQPMGAPVFDSAGALYGATLQGGVYNEGAIFELAPPATQGGSWTESTLYSIAATGADGYFPVAGLVLDAAGSLNGVTEIGGDASCNCGTAFRLSPPSDSGGVWTFSVLHAFLGGDDGAFPQAPLASSGTNLYGTTSQGGASSCQQFNLAGCGTLLEVTP
jgi:hypothetical protein